MQLLRGRAAFTLIELLIVVAIIAILAGIAVVNFLEAQIRAKVSRVQSDLRTMATAVELYRVDHAGYPTYHYVNNPYANANVSFHVGGDVTSILVSPPFNGRNPLTTPIPYITSSPKDVFTKDVVEASPETADYWYVNWDFALQRTDSGLEPLFQALRNDQGNWRMHSTGPDNHGPDTEVGLGQIVYDATNGTISHGEVVRTQKQGQT